MARAWAHRQQFFYNLIIDMDDDTYRYTAADCGSYVEPVEFSDFAATLTAPQAVNRVRAIRIMHMP